MPRRRFRACDPIAGRHDPRRAEGALSGELALSARVAKVQELAVSVADPSDVGAYPITTYSWMFLYLQYREQAKGAAVVDFAQWGLGLQGQNYGARLGYLPLSADVVAIGTQALAGRTH
jgi:ABC-type phosphate transport system substrate-binding protein